MGSAVSNFISNAATSALKWVAKTGTSFVLGKVPVIGGPIADWLNRQYRKGGRVHTFADGGMLNKLQEEGIKTQVINTPAQLIAAIKKFPAEAKKAGLTVAMVKEAKEEKLGNVMSKPVEEAATESQEALKEGAMMKRGGRKHHGHGHVVEVPQHAAPHHAIKAHHKKRHHKHHEEEHPAMAHGGMPHPAVASLPYSDLDRLNIPVHAQGGVHHMDVGLGQSDHEESYVQLHHGHPGHHGHHARAHGHHGHHGHHGAHVRAHGLHGRHH